MSKTQEQKEEGEKGQDRSLGELYGFCWALGAWGIDEEDKAAKSWNSDAEKHSKYIKEWEFELSWEESY